MSLDVYLEVPAARGTDHGELEERIYVRVDGRTRQVTRKEWDELYPGREPVVARIPDADGSVFSANITHNLGKMAAEAGIYEQLWRPEEVGITHARQLVEPLRDGLGELNADPERFKAFNPENGWGNYEGLCAFTAEYLAACERWPEAEVRVWK